MSSGVAVVTGKVISLFQGLTANEQKKLSHHPSVTFVDTSSDFDNFDGSFKIQIPLDPKTHGKNAGFKPPQYMGYNP